MINHERFVELAQEEAKKHTFNWGPSSIRIRFDSNTGSFVLDLTNLIDIYNPNRLLSVSQRLYVGDYYPAEDKILKKAFATCIRRGIKELILHEFQERYRYKGKQFYYPHIADFATVTL